MIAVFTSNQPRHLALIDALVAAEHNVVAVIEPKSFAPNGDTPVMRRYWSFVFAAERRVFERRWTTVPTLAARPGEASLLPADAQARVLAADRIVVFGSSYLKGPFAEALIARGALNLHVGIAPELRGSAPNFWAEYIGRPDLVGAQVQRLATGLDTGDILADVRPPSGGDPFDRGMEAARLGIEALVALVDDPPSTPIRANDRAQEVKYSRYADFTDEVVTEYLTRLGR